MSILQKFIVFSFVILLSNLVIGYAVYESKQNFQDSQQWVEHTEHVIYETNNILSMSKDLESASQGFVITNDSSFLQHVWLTEKTIFACVEELRKLTHDNHTQLQRADSLNFYVCKRLQFSFEMVALRSQQGLSMASAYATSKQGKYYTDRMQQIITTIQQEETKLLDQRKKINEHSMTIFNWFSVGMFVVMVVFTLLFIMAAGNYLLQIREKERRAAELVIANKELQRLLELNTDKDQFISILAHDLRSPFNSILGFLELLTENIHTYDIATIKKQIGFINYSAKGTYNLLEDLILWMQSQSGKLPYNPQTLVVKDVFVDIIRFLTPNATSKNIAINYSVAEILTVYADCNMLKSILRNLVSNAIKFSNSDGQITLNAEQAESMVSISITDNGIGIAPEVVTKLLDFSQTQSTMGTANEKGTGMGLLLCNEFVKKHGGTLRIESELEKGSSFIFTLPSAVTTL